MRGWSSIRGPATGRFNWKLTVDGNVAQSGGTVVLHIGISAAQQADEDRNSARIDELLSVLVAVCHVE